MSLVTMSILHWENESNLFDGLNTNENLNLKQTYYNIYLEVIWSLQKTWISMY